MIKRFLAFFALCFFLLLPMAGHGGTERYFIYYGGCTTICPDHTGCSSLGVTSIAGAANCASIADAGSGYAMFKGDVQFSSVQCVDTEYKGMIYSCNTCTNDTFVNVNLNDLLGGNCDDCDYSDISNTDIADIFNTCDNNMGPNGCIIGDGINVCVKKKTTGCPANYYQNGGSCQPCGTGSMSCNIPNGSGTKTCDKTSPAGSTAASACTIDASTCGTCYVSSCNARYYKNTNTTCTSCANGTYTMENNTSTSCAPCTGLPDNAQWTSNGTSPTGCLWECNDGFVQNGNVCVAVQCDTTTTTGNWETTDNIVASRTLTTTDCNNVVVATSTEYGCAANTICTSNCDADLSVPRECAACPENGNCSANQIGHSSSVFGCIDGYTPNTDTQTCDQNVCQEEYSGWTTGQNNVVSRTGINTLCDTVTEYGCAAGTICTSNCDADPSVMRGCAACPENGNCSANQIGHSSSDFTCDSVSGFYKDGQKCNQCPVAAKTTYTDGGDKVRGVYNASLRECVLPAGTYWDDTGKKEVSENKCYYDPKVSNM